MPDLFPYEGEIDAINQQEEICHNIPAAKQQEYEGNPQFCGTGISANHHHGYGSADNGIQELKEVSRFH